MGGKGSGRKPKSHNRRNTQLTIAETSPQAAAYLREVAEGNAPPLKRTITRKNGDVIEEEMWGGDSIRVDVCKYIINQDIGMPKGRTEVTGPNGGPQKLLVRYDGSQNKHQTGSDVGRG